MNIHHAKPLLLVPLDQQIRDLGGPGYTVAVRKTPISGSFSVLYSFPTPAGEKHLLTRNEFQVGVIDEELSHYVLFHGDVGEFSLVTPRTFNKAPFKRLDITGLGCSFDGVVAMLKSIWPSRVIWRLTNPASVGG